MSMTYVCATIVSDEKWKGSCAHLRFNRILRNKLVNVHLLLLSDTGRVVTFLPQKYKKGMELTDYTCQ